MADIVNKVLKILIFCLILSNNVAHGRKRSKYNKKTLRKDRPGSSISRVKGIGRDVIDDEYHYDRLRSRQSPGREEPAKSRFDNNGNDRDAINDEHHYDRLGSRQSSRREEPAKSSFDNNGNDRDVIDDEYHYNRLRSRQLPGREEPAKSRLDNNGNDRDVIDDEHHYNRLRSRQSPRREEPAKSRFDNNGGEPDNSDHDVEDDQNLKRYIYDPVERYKQSRLVNANLTFQSITNPPRARNPATRRTQRPAWQQRPAVRTTQRPAVRATQRNVIPNQNVYGQYSQSTSNPASVLQQGQPAVQSSINNQNLNQPGGSNAYQPGGQREQYREEDLLSQQKNDLNAQYGGQREQYREEDLLSQQQNDLNAQFATPSIVSDPCLSQPCQNSGMCQKDTVPRGFSCVCDEGFQGQDCEIQTTPCDIAGCTSVDSCIRAKESELCSCKTQYGVKFCSKKLPSLVDNVGAKIEEQVKVLTKGDRKYEIIAIAVVFVVACLLIHCFRVDRRRKEIQDEYKRMISRGEQPLEEPPGCFAVSNMLCIQFFCCGNEDDDKPKVKPKESERSLFAERRQIFEDAERKSSYPEPPDTESRRESIRRESLSAGYPGMPRESMSKKRFSIGNVDLSYNAKLERKKRRAKRQRRREESANRYRRQARQNLRDLQAKTVRSCYKPSKRHGRNVRDEIYSEDELLSERPAYSESATGDSDEGAESVRRRSNKFVYNQSSKEKHGKTNLVQSWDSSKYDAGFSRNNHSNIMYPNISANIQNSPHLRRCYSENQPQERLGYSNYSGAGYSQIFGTRAYYPIISSAQRIERNASMARFGPNYPSFINTNNNMNAMQLNMSNNCPENYIKTEHKYENEEGIYSSNDESEEYFTYGKHIETEPNIYGYGQYTFRNNYSLSNDDVDNSNEVIAKYEEILRYSPRCFCDPQFLCLHNYAYLIQSLVDQCSDDTEINDQSNEEMPAENNRQNQNSLTWHEEPPSGTEKFLCRESESRLFSEDEDSDMHKDNTEQDTSLQRPLLQVEEVCDPTSILPGNYMDVSYVLVAENSLHDISKCTDENNVSIINPDGDDAKEAMDKISEDSKDTCNEDVKSYEKDGKTFYYSNDGFEENDKQLPNSISEDH